MKRSKRLYILLGILAAAIAATAGLMQVNEQKEKIKNSDEIILEIPGDSVLTLSWENESGALAFHKDENWLYDEDEAFPVDEEKINELLGLFEEFGVSFIIEEVEDFAQYGLDDPICTINLTTEDEEYEILLGDYSKMDSERYVSVGDGNVYLVKEDPLDSFDAVLNDMIKQDEVPSLTDVTGIRFSGAEAYEIVYEEESSDTYCPEDVYFVSGEEKNLPLDSDNVKEYIRSIRYLDLDEYVTYNASEEEIKDCGLDSPELSVSVDYTYEDEDGGEAADTFVLNVSRDPEEKQEKSSAEDEEEEDGEDVTAYARVGESQIIYKISSEDYKSLMAASYDDLRHKEVLTADFSDIEQIDITLEGVSYTISSEKKDDTRTWYYADEELEINGLQTAIQALSADSFTDEAPSLKEEIHLTVHLDNEYYPEVDIDIYRYDGTYCLVELDGETVSLIERSQAVDLIEAVNSIVLN